MKETKILITGGGGVTGRAIARSIKLSPIYKNAILISADIYQNKYGIFEGLFDRCYKMPHVEANNYYLKMEELINIENPDVVLIMTEKEAIYWGTKEKIFDSLISPYEFSFIAGNKARLYSVLENSKLVPKHVLFNKIQNSFEKIFIHKFNSKPVWVRCYEEGTSSGRGAYLVKTLSDAKAWFDMNPSITSYLVSDLLPGGNYACNLLFYHGKLLQYAIYERLEYFMPHLSPSGITGNICVGKLINDKTVLDNSLKSIRAIESKTSTKANGIYTVDLKGDNENNPLITEINLRHTAATSSFAQAGCNMAEYQISATLGKFESIPQTEIIFNQNNKLLRDIDGLPVYVPDFQNQYREKLIDFNQ